jgi:hypothetical protein
VGAEMINEIKKTLTNIISILHSNNENAWAKTFETLGSELDVDCEASIFALKFTVEWDHLTILFFTKMGNRSVKKMTNWKI